MTPFERGFFKAAAQHNIKQADVGSWFSKYLNMKAQPSQGKMDHPWKALSSVPGTVVDNGLATFTGIAPGFGEMMGSRAALGGDPKTREKTMKDSTQDTNSRSYGQQAMHGLKKSGPAALVSGLAGGGMGYLLGHMMNRGQNIPGMPAGLPTIHTSPWATAAGGAIGGAASAAGTMTLVSLLNKLVTNNTKPENQAKSRDLKAKHPYATALPFGDMIGAAVA